MQQQTQLYGQKLKITHAENIMNVIAKLFKY